MTGYEALFGWLGVATVAYMVAVIALAWLIDLPRHKRPLRKTDRL